MESKTKHRILGIVVVAGLAVLAYPLIQGSSITPNAQVLVKAPPFPDQAIQVSAADTDVTAQEPISPIAAESPSMTPTPDVPVPDQQTALPNEANAENISAAATPPAAPVPDAPAGNAPATTAEPVTPPVTGPSSASSAPSAESAPAVPSTASETQEHTIAPATEGTLKAAPPPANTTSDAQVNNQGQDEQKKVVKKKKLAKSRTTKTPKPVIYSKISSGSGSKLAYKQLPLDSNGLIQLKKSAWVIQLGSFKQKSNALKLVNRLRAKGYRAFIQNVNLASGENTRVFVGPEHQQASARIVAAELANEMKLNGIVLSYKPFTL